jgi:predicted RNA-binding Zn-ribbon protein involved in translation (DUF1610 family)
MSSRKLEKVAFVAVCPHCGETVQVEVTRKQAKTVFQAFQGKKKALRQI